MRTWSSPLDPRFHWLQLRYRLRYVHEDLANSGSLVVSQSYTYFYCFQPVVLFTKSKEGGFYPSQMRGDYAMIGDDGAITSPTIAELSAQALMRFLEVHEKRVPYE